MRFLHGAAQHIGARRSQEDSFGFSDPTDREHLAHAGFLAVLCDGMGGMKHGARASQTAVAAFLEAYKSKTPEETIHDALHRSVKETNAKVLAVAAELGATEGMGTTLIAAVLHKGLLYHVSVGDSGLFHFTQRRLRLLNRHHVFGRLLDQAVARGVITEEAAREHPERDALTSFIGVEPLEEIDLSADPLRLSAGDSILIASDGLFNTLSILEIRNALEGDPRRWPSALVSKTIEKGNEYQDNVTVLTIHLLSQ